MGHSPTSLKQTNLQAKSRRGKKIFGIKINIFIAFPIL